MLDSIHVGMTGLQGYSRGLRVIANNTANLDTPGYKSSTLQFADMFYSSGGAAGSEATQLGHGLATTGTQLDVRQGDLRDTGNPFDLGVDGDGLFVLRLKDGSTRYTRAGNFQFDGEGRLADRTDGALVLGHDATRRRDPDLRRGTEDDARGCDRRGPLRRQLVQHRGHADGPVREGP
jgi:flagellar hook protein FlgE